MEGNEQDWADQVGKRISEFILGILAVFFAYGLLGWIVFG